MQRVHRGVEGELAALGPNFATETHGPAARVALPWRALSELIARPVTLDARIEATRAALLARGDAATVVDLRVVASVVQLGIVARILAPAIGSYALGLGQIDVHPRNLVAGQAGWAVSHFGFWLEPVGEFRLQGFIVDRITMAVGARYWVSMRVLRGNVGSAANSAARMIAGSRPDLAPQARALASKMLADVGVDEGKLRSTSSFRRRSCCLIYRVADSRSAVCGDCGLRD